MVSIQISPTFSAAFDSIRFFSAELYALPQPSERLSIYIFPFNAIFLNSIFIWSAPVCQCVCVRFDLFVLRENLIYVVINLSASLSSLLRAAAH